MLDSAQSRKALLSLKDSGVYFRSGTMNLALFSVARVIYTELTLTRTGVTTAMSIYLPTFTVFRSSLVAPVIAVYLINSVILCPRIERIILEVTLVSYQTKPYGQQ